MQGQINLININKVYVFFRLKIKIRFPTIVVSQVLGAFVCVYFYFLL